MAATGRKSTIVLTVRNEGAFLLEWLAHHKMAGFTDFLVFSNDCQDGTDAMLDRLQELGVLVHVRNNGTDKGGVQWGALKQADKHPLVKNADWVLAVDIDEFVNIHVGDHKLDDLFAAIPDASAITLTWRLFGNAGVRAFRAGPILDQFTKCAPNPMFWPWKASMFKTLYRNDGTYGKMGVHRPKQPDPARLPAFRWFDGSGRELPDLFKKNRIFSDYWQDNFAIVQLNHYPLGAMESYILKQDRGRAVHSRDALGLEYWVDRNYNEAEDTSILQTQDERAAILAGFMADKSLSRLYAGACDWRKARFDALLKDENVVNFYGRLMMTPSTRALERTEAADLMRLARRSIALRSSGAGIS